MTVAELVRNKLTKAGQLAVEEVLREDGSLSDIVSSDLATLYAIHESSQVEKAMRKLADKRIEGGVSWAQLADFFGRVTRAPGQRKSASKKVIKLQDAVAADPDNADLQAKLQSALAKEEFAVKEAVYYASLLTKAKKLNGGGNHG